MERNCFMFAKIMHAAGIFLATVLACIVLMNLTVVLSTMSRIVPSDRAQSGADYILVLGASVIDNAYPSHMLEDRILTAVELYEQGAADKIIMSGDHRADDYNEPQVMCDYAVSCGVPREDIVLDHRGISPYDSMYRMAEFAPNSRVIIVTQRYHLFRSIYIARAMKLDAVGVSASLRDYSKPMEDQFRESLARVKDFIAVILRPESADIKNI